MVMKTDWKKLIGSVAIPLAVGGLSALITKDSMVVFEYVDKPPLSPPMWLFPVVWSILYILMGLALYYVRVSNASIQRKRAAYVYYALQLAFNFGWPIFFFNMEAFLTAFIWLCVMWLFILLTIIKFFDIDKKAGWLMIPYILWSTFALYLNYGVYMLNK